MSRLGLGVGQKRYPNLYSHHVANGTKYHNIFLEVVTRGTDYGYAISFIRNLNYNFKLDFGFE